VIEKERQVSHSCARKVRWHPRRLALRTICKSDPTVRKEEGKNGRTESFVELEDVTTSETESISPTRIEEEISTAEQVQVGQSMENPNDKHKP
jgi:hypothetical protein